jgi:hypothetical protein
MNTKLARQRILPVGKSKFQQRFKVPNSSTTNGQGPMTNETAELLAG